MNSHLVKTRRINGDVALLVLFCLNQQINISIGNAIARRRGVNKRPKVNFQRDFSNTALFLLTIFDNKSRYEAPILAAKHTKMALTAFKSKC